MSQFKIYVDKLEIAYQRNNVLEDKLYPPKNYDDKEPFNWQLDTSKLTHEERAEYDERFMEELCNPEDEVTLDNWRFIKGLFPGPNTNYKFNLQVSYINQYGGEEVFGYLYFETYQLRRNNIYFRADNRALYGDNFWQKLHELEEVCGLNYVHVSKVDIALDSSINTSERIYNQIKRNKTISWVINGRCIKSRQVRIKNLFWVTAGSLENPEIYRNLYIKQAEGLCLCCYNKTVEIHEKSFKEYQTSDWWDNDDFCIDENIYRNEVRLNRKNIIDYNEGHHLNDVEFRARLLDSNSLLETFKNVSRKLIRWRMEKVIIDIPTMIRNSSTSKSFIAI